MVKKKRVLFVNPYFGEWQSLRSVAATNAPPLGLGYVATWVRDHTDAEVTLIDPVPMKMSREDVLEIAGQYDIVGAACFTDVRFYCFDFIKDLKDRYPHVLVVVGGPHTFFLDQLIMKHYPAVDLVVRGEGELTMTEIVQGRSYSEIDGCTYRRADGCVVRNEDRALRDNLDDFYIDYAGLLPPMHLYSGDNEAPLALRQSLSAYLIESRGCPFSCSYCANDHWYRSWRGTSPAVIVEKMINIYERTGLTYFRFFDDLFTANETRVLEFCRLLKAQNLPIKFRVLVRAGTSENILKALKDAGCTSVGFGIESGSNKILNHINKKIKTEQVLKTIEDCRSLGLWVVGSFIVSFEGETLEDYEKTLALCSQVDLFQTNIQIIFPYTPFYLRLKERGELDDEIWFDRQHDGRILYTRENFPSAPWHYRDLKWMALKTYYEYVIHNRTSARAFYGNRRFLFQFFKALIDLPCKGKLDHFWKLVRKSPT